jgi:uncharacterized protein
MRVFIVILAALGLAACSGGEKAATIEELGTVEVIFPNGARLLAESMTQQVDLMRGLMFRDLLPPNRGMIFYYPNDDKHTHWMYQVKIPIDIIWLDKSHRIVEMAPDTPPCPSKSARECPSFGGQQISRFALELNAGLAAKNGLRIGDRLEF